MNRRILRVQYISSAWRIVGPGVPVACRQHATKAAAVAVAASACRDDWRWFGKLGQVVIHGKDGRIQTERTYGKDPRRTPG